MTNKHKSQSPPQPHYSAEQIGKLRSRLERRGEQTRRLALLYLACAIAAVVAGVTGTIFATDVIRRDREQLLTVEDQETISTNREEIERIDSSLDHLPTAEHISALQDVFQSSDGRTAIAVGTDGTILASQDGGNTWRKRDSPVTQHLLDVALYPDNRRGIAVGAAGTMIRTDDGGLSWSEIITDHENTMLTVALHPDRQKGLAAGEQGTLMETVDGGRTWNTRQVVQLEVPPIMNSQPTLYTRDIHDIQLSEDGTRGVALGSGTLFWFQYGEQSWERPPVVGALIEAVAFSADLRSGFASETIGSIKATSDAGRTWTDSLSADFIGNVGIAVSGDGSRAVAVTYDGSAHLTEDTGNIWTVATVHPSESLESVSLSRDGQSAIAIGTDSLFTSPDGGTTWYSYNEAAEQARSRLIAERTSLFRTNQDLHLPFLARMTGDQGDNTGTAELDTLDYLAVTATWRLPILVFTLLLVQVFFGLNRYNTRLAAFYFARVDVLSLFDPDSGSPPVETIERMTRILSPDVVDFGRSSGSMTDRAIAMARELSDARSARGT